MTLRTNFLLLSAILFLLVLNGFASAATIITGGDNGEGLNLAGQTPIYAVRFNGSSVVVQNTTFYSSTAAPGSSDVTVSAPFSTYTNKVGATFSYQADNDAMTDTVPANDTNMAAILGGGIYGTGGANMTNLTLTLNGLTASTTYTLDLLVSGGGYGAGRVDNVTVNGSAFDSVTMTDTDAYDLNGTFTTGASATTATVSITSTSSSFAPTISGLVVSTTPEPGVAGLALVGAVGFLARRRRLAV